MDIRKLKQLKEDLRIKQQEIDRAEGALQTIQIRLEKEFGCKSLEQGKRIVSEKEKALESKKKLYEKLIKKYEQADDN